MKSIFPHLVAVLCFMFVFVALPLVSIAQQTGTGGGGTPTQSTLKVSLQNPLGSTTLIGFFNKIIDIILIFAIPIIVFFIILAGFKYVTAGGNAHQVEEATHALTWALVGGVLILGAKALLVIIQNTVNALKN